MNLSQMNSVDLMIGLSSPDSLARTVAYDAINERWPTNKEFFAALKKDGFTAKHDYEPVGVSKKRGRPLGSVSNRSMV